MEEGGIFLANDEAEISKLRLRNISKEGNNKGNQWQVSTALAPKNQDKISATDLYEHSKKENPDTFKQELETALIIVDDREMSKKDLDKIPADEIQSICVLKGESAEKKYGEKGKNGVAKVTLKKKDVTVGGPNRSPLIIIDGKEASLEKMENINPSHIKSVSVLKDEQAIKKYGEKAKDGVVEIVTKKE